MSTPTRTLVSLVKTNIPTRVEVTDSLFVSYGCKGTIVTSEPDIFGAGGVYVHIDGRPAHTAVPFFLSELTVQNA